VTHTRKDSLEHRLSVDAHMLFCRGCCRLFSDPHQSQTEQDAWRPRVRTRKRRLIRGNTLICSGVTMGHHSMALPKGAAVKSATALSTSEEVPAKLRSRIEVDYNRTRFVAEQAEDPR